MRRKLEARAGTWERRLRLQVAMHVNELLARRALTQAETTKLLEIAQPHVSELKNYNLSRFSLARLLGFLTLLDCDVEILIRPKTGRAGQLTVSFA